MLGDGVTWSPRPSSSTLAGSSCHAPGVHVPSPLSIGRDHAYAVMYGEWPSAVSTLYSVTTGATGLIFAFFIDPQRVRRRFSAVIHRRWIGILQRTPLDASHRRFPLAALISHGDDRLAVSIVDRNVDEPNARETLVAVEHPPLAIARRRVEPRMIAHALYYGGGAAVLLRDRRNRRHDDRGCDGGSGLRPQRPRDASHRENCARCHGDADRGVTNHTVASRSTCLASHFGTIPFGAPARKPRHEWRG